MQLHIWQRNQCHFVTKKWFQQNTRKTKLKGNAKSEKQQCKENNSVGKRIILKNSKKLPPINDLLKNLFTPLASSDHLYSTKPNLIDWSSAGLSRPPHRQISLFRNKFWQHIILKSKKKYPIIHFSLQKKLSISQCSCNSSAFKADFSGIRCYDASIWIQRKEAKTIQIEFNFLLTYYNTWPTFPSCSAGTAIRLAVARRSRRRVAHNR